jgi:enamine deaminase RidA (YjgF/YER057c/UK114 family)
MAETFRRLADRVAVERAEIVALFVYGAVDDRGGVGEAMRAGMGEASWPVTWVEGASCSESRLAGLQAIAWRGAVERVRIGGRVVGTVYADGVARHCWLGGIGAQVLSLPRAAQVQQMFGVAELALDLAGFELRDVARTWFYNEDILAWYGAFNRVRTAFYAGVQWRSGSLPASTGIGARNARGAALEVALRAWRPLAESGAAIAPVELASPLQCPAPAYGSSFSRAIEVRTGARRWISVSGTASIHPDGRTAWEGDARRQVDVTMEVVAAILRSRGLAWTDVTRATAYYRDVADVRHLRAWQIVRGLERLPVVHTASVVCRDDLLFEIEVDAVRE